jgi:hypothetical protein
VSPGTRLVTAYFGVFYLIPMIGNLVFRKNIDTIYYIYPITPYVMTLFVGVFAMFMLLSRGPTIRIVPTSVVSYFGRSAVSLGSIYVKHRLAFALVLLCVSIYYAALGAGNYRYLAESLSESDSPLAIIVIVLNLVVTLDLFYCMFARPAGKIELRSRLYLENVLLAVCLVLTANGTGGMLVGLVSVAYALAPVWFHGLLFTPRRERGWVATRRLVVVGIFGATAFGAAWIAGETIKVSAGVNRDLASAWHSLWEIMDATRFLEGYGYYLITAFSSYYYTVLFSANAASDVLAAGAMNAVIHPLESLLFRLDYLLGGLLHVSRPEFGSLSRLNYMLLSTEPQLSLRQGSSPGLIGSFNYVLPFPLNFLAAALYLRWIARLTDRLLRAHQKETLSVLGVVLLLFYMLLLFQSPFDLLIVLDNATMHVLILVGMVLAQDRAGALDRNAAVPAALHSPALVFPAPPRRT